MSSQSWQGLTALEFQYKHKHHSFDWPRQTKQSLSEQLETETQEGGLLFSHNTVISRYTFVKLHKITNSL